MILYPFRRRPLALATVLAAGVVSAACLTPCDAQAQDEREVRIARTPGGVTIMRGAPANRAVLGVTLGEGSRADTAGVRLEGVDPDSPAAKAGLKAGDIITEINGTSLKVAREDAEDLALTGLAQRRLQRVMAKARPGDEVRLQVRSGNATRAVTVKTASPTEIARSADKTGERVMERRAATKRGMVGVSVGSAGNARDTLGLFVSSVVTGGAADKAGIVEGERIAAVNGTDVRVPREDVDDGQAASARVERFVNAVRNTEPGKTLSLRVWGNGRYRDVSVTVQEATGMMGGFEMLTGDMLGGDMLRGEMLRGEMLPRRLMIEGEQLPRMRMQMNPGPGGEVRIRRNGGEPHVFEFNRDGARGRVRINGGEVEFDGEGLQKEMEELGRQIRERVQTRVQVRTRATRAAL